MELTAERDILTAKALRVAFDPLHPEFEILLEAASIIRHGGAVAYPTETFYGLGVDPFNASAVERLYRIKGRQAARALILLISQPGQAFDLALMPGPIKRWYEKLTAAFWPGPLTLVLPARRRPVCAALAGGDSVAVRLSSDRVAWQLARTTGIAITSTSANRSGGAPATSADQIEPAVAAQLDLIIDAGVTPGGPPSTLLDLTRGRPVILRQGKISAEEIASVISLHPLSFTPEAAGNAQP
jgi:L-threonylcarbamoyladenylate synthase